MILKPRVFLSVVYIITIWCNHIVRSILKTSEKFEYDMMTRYKSRIILEIYSLVWLLFLIKSQYNSIILLLQDYSVLKVSGFPS